MSPKLVLVLVSLWPLAEFAEAADLPTQGPSSRRFVTLDGRNVNTSEIVIDLEHPHSFRYRSGERFFPMGDTAYFLIVLPKHVIARYIDVRRAHKFNFIRMMAIADGFWPFGGTPSEPDYTTVNEAALRKLDWVFDFSATRGMNIELILWGYGIGAAKDCGPVERTRICGSARW